MSGYETYGMSQLLAMVALAGMMIAVFAAVILYQRRKQRRMLMNKIRREWGQVPERKYYPTEFDCISHYYLNK